MSRPTIFSFFAGAGFLDLGFESNLFEIAYVNEFHKPFMEIYKFSRHKLNLPEPKYGYFNGDIACLLEGHHKSRLDTYIKESSSNSDIIGFIGGPPCPDFSVGGKNRGSSGDNGKLSATYAELICQQKPAFFLFENVKGLWQTKKHREFYEAMKRKFHDHGYFTVERLVNALEYGVPQHRDRIILIGFHETLLRELNHQELQFPWENYLSYRSEEIFALEWPTTNQFEEDSSLLASKGIELELTIEHWFKKNDVQSHPNAEMHFQPRAGITKFLAIPEGDDSKKSYKRLHRWRYSPAAAYGNNEVHLHPYKARRISVAEALAVQSLPKEFALPQDTTLTNAFKSIGNGVPYLASKSIAKSIFDFLGCK